MLWQTLHDFTYMLSKAFLSGILVDFATHHTASKSFEILHASSNHCLLIRKLSLMELWCTAYRFLEFTSGSHILSLLLCAWIFQTFQIVTKPLETLHKWPNKSLLKKKLTLDYLEHILVLWQTFMISPICLPRPFSVAYWLIWQLTILYRNHLKFCMHRRITAFW